ncbi:MAG: baseplate J/gp47 family protein, partial [Candidatus Dormiibacterota bacterium]
VHPAAAGRAPAAPAAEVATPLAATQEPYPPFDDDEEAGDEHGFAEPPRGAPRGGSGETWAPGPERGGAPTRRATPARSVVADRVPPSTRRYVLYGAAAAVLLAGIVAFVLLVPSATVTLVAQSRGFTTNVDLTAQPGTGPVAVRTQVEGKSVSEQFAASGQLNSPGAKAAGTIQYQNQCPLVGPIGISQGAVVVAQSGVQFVQQGDATVPFNQTASAPIQAQSDGANGNVDANQITSLQGAGVWSSCLHVTNPQPTTGGKDPKQQTVITANDIAQAKAQLQQRAMQEISGDLQNAKKQDEKLSDQDPVVFGTPSFQTDHAVQSSVQTFVATLTIKGTAAYYQPAQVATAFRRQLATRVPSGQQLTQDPISAQYLTSGSTGGHLDFKGRAVGSIAPKLDLSAIQSQVKGQTDGQANSQLRRLPVAQVQIAQYPFPLPMLPLLGSRIDVRYVVESSPSPVPSPSPS